MAGRGQSLSTAARGPILLGRGADGKAYALAVDPATGQLIVQLAAAPTIDIGKVEILGDDGLVLIGAQGDAADSHTDTTKISWTSILKQLSASVQASATALGATTGAAVVTDANATIQQYLRGLIKNQVAGAGVLSIVGSRPLTAIKGNLAVTNSAYAATKCIGGLITIATGLAAGTIITPTIRWRTTFDNVSTFGGGQVLFFDANPSASTFTDGNAVSLNAADIAKVVTNAGLTNGTGVVSGNAYQMSAVGTRLPVDGSGYFYVAIVATTTITFAASGNLAQTVDGLY